MDRFPPIIEILPHRPPMILLDEVLVREGERIVCAATIREEGPFVQARRVQAVVMLEYMAQCIAAFAGLNARSRGQPIRPGLLVACREMDLAVDAVGVGARLVVEAERIWGDRAFGFFECTVTEGGEALARASLSVALEGIRVEG